MTFQTELSPIRWLFLAHALAGAIALLLLWVPLLTKKGAKTHVRTGWVYTGAMSFVVLSTFVITPWRALVDPARTQESLTFAIFLAFIAVFTASALVHGLIVLKYKNRTAPSTSLIHVGLPKLTIVAGLATQLIGLKFQSMLLMIFPVLGHSTALGQLKYWRAAPAEKMHWWYQHMAGMFVACIATVTAFLVTALPRFVPEARSPLLWIAPGLILGTLSSRWTARYRAQFEKAR